MLRNKKGIVALACFSAVFGSGVHAADILKDIPINISAKVVPESCYQVVDGEGLQNIDVTLPDITMAEARKIKERGSDGVIQNIVDYKIEFQCSSGTYANFSIEVNPVDSCTVESGGRFTCSGVNKSFGISPGLKWFNKDDKQEWYAGFYSNNSGEVKTVKLTKNRGQIQFYYVWIRPVKDKTPLPGLLEANFILKIWQA